MKLKAIPSAKAAFSLVEMLVVIAVIGIIAAIAVPNIGKINDAAKDSTKRRNAQNIASVFASAQAAGHDFSKDAAGDTLAGEKEMIEAVIAGATISDVSSPFDGAYFGIPGMNATDAVDETDGAAKYLTWDATSGQLQYTGGKD